MRIKKSLFMAVFGVIIFPAMGFCLSVTAHVDKLKISRQDSVYLTVEVSGGKADLDLSQVKDFKVISRGSSSSYNYINGKSERKASYQYLLLPLSKGALTIPALKASAGGRTAFTKPIVIQVSDQVVNPDEAKAIFAKAKVTKARLFVGEQAIYTLTFFTSKRLSGLGFERPPEFKEFSSQQFEKEKSYNLNINGMLYNVTEVNYVIIPSKTGEFTIDPAVLVANVIVKSKRDPQFDSFFNDSFFSSNSYKPLRVTSNPLKIIVSPIPPYPGEGRFSGLVGRFDIQGTIDKTSLKSGDSATFTIKISGSGNIMDASLPKIDLDEDAFKIYDDNPVETIQLTENGYEGFKLFKKAIVPVNPGKYVISPVSLTYFDVDQKAFKTVSTKQINLDVIPSEKIQVAASTLNSSAKRPVAKTEVSLVNKDILDIKEGIDVLKDYRQIDPLFFLLLLSIPAVLFSGVKLFVVVGKKQISVERQMAEKARFHFKQARKKGSKNKDFLGHLYSGIVALIMAKEGKKTEVVTVAEARDILQRARIDAEGIQEITALLGTIESIRFGGRKIDENKAGQLLLKAKQVAKLFCLALMCVGVFTVVPQKALADSANTFVQGVNHYKAGQFIQAAKEFEAVAAHKIKNPYLFYNIANAYLKANDIGHVILWYERAKILAPNDPDLRFNLEYANTLVKDKKDNTLNLMEILFFWEHLVSPKMIQISAVFFSFLFFTWAAIRALKRQKVFSGMGLILCSLFVLFTVVTGVDYYKPFVRSSAIVVEKEAAVRSGITPAATTLFTLHAGTKVRVEGTRDGYMKIVFSRDKIGWMKKEQATRIRF